MPVRPIAARHSTFIFRCSCYLHGRCTPARIQQHLGKVSGPLLDRIYIHVEVPAVPLQQLRQGATAESSAEIRCRVERARAIRQARGYYNCRMPSRLIRKERALNPYGERTLEMAVRRMGFSTRPHDRILKVVRTIADLGGSETVIAKHVEYRSLDRNYWN